MQEVAVQTAAHRKAAQLASNAGLPPVARLGPNLRPRQELTSKSHDQLLKRSRELLLRSPPDGRSEPLLGLAPLRGEELSRCPLSIGMHPSRLQSLHVLPGH